MADQKSEQKSTRFYATVSVKGAGSSFSIALDGRALRTPLKGPLQLPAQALAEAIAEEWRVQQATIDPFSMPLTKLANTVIDRVDPDRPRIVREIVKFAGSDLVCYRAGEPERLRERQAAGWDPVLVWASQALDANLLTTSGLVYREQPKDALNGIRIHLDAQSSWRLAALHNMTTLIGSALLALMAAARAVTVDEAWSLAHIDEDWQIEQWGADAEAEARRSARFGEFAAALRFVELLAG